MKHSSLRHILAGGVVVLTMTLSGCGSSLPPDAQDAILGAFDYDSKPTIDQARQVELLPEDEALNAEQVWCVSVVYTCWSCDYGEYRKCGDNRLLRLIGGEWQIALVASEQDKEAFIARGCRLLDDFAGQ